MMLFQSVNRSGDRFPQRRGILADLVGHQHVSLCESCDNLEFRHRLMQRQHPLGVLDSVELLPYCRKVPAETAIHEDDQDRHWKHKCKIPDEKLG